jgi:hypothetical protein
MSEQGDWIGSVLERLAGEGRIIIISPNVTIKVYIASPQASSTGQTTNNTNEGQGQKGAERKPTNIDVFELARRHGVNPPLVIEKGYFKSKDHVRAVAKKYGRTHVAVVGNNAILIPSNKIADFKQYGDIYELEEYLANVNLPEHDERSKRKMRPINEEAEDGWYEAYKDLLPSR